MDMYLLAPLSLDQGLSQDPKSLYFHVFLQHVHPELLLQVSYYGVRDPPRQKDRSGTTKVGCCEVIPV